MTSNTRHEHHWVTINVTPLRPGWVNVFCYNDPERIKTSPCPALLTQELRSKSRFELRSTISGETIEEEHVTKCYPPFATRVVAAEMFDGELDPAPEVARWGHHAAFSGTEYKPTDLEEL